MSTLPSNIPACNFYHPSGRRCGSPAQRGSDFCFWHEEVRAVPSFPTLPPLDSPEAIQLGIVWVTNALIMGYIKDKRAGLLLYALQIAATNLRTMAKAKEAQAHQLQEQAEFAPAPEAVCEQHVPPRPVPPADPAPVDDLDAICRIRDKWEADCRQADADGKPWPQFPNDTVDINACVDPAYVPAPQGRKILAQHVSAGKPTLSPIHVLSPARDGTHRPVDTAKPHYGGFLSAKIRDPRLGFHWQLATDYC